MEDTYYVEVNWDGYNIANSGKKYQFTVGLYYGDKWDPSNDWSYDGLEIYDVDDAFFGTGNEVRTDNICVYSDGVLIGGTEPDGSKPAAPEVPATTEAEDTTPSTKPDDELRASKYGDANCDKAVDIADTVLVKCYLINGETYSLTKQGAVNADVHNCGNGINVQDAVAIQKSVLKLIDSLPVK
jgi:hypothetical protein